MTGELFSRLAHLAETRHFRANPGSTWKVIPVKGRAAGGYDTVEERDSGSGEVRTIYTVGGRYGVEDGRRHRLDGPADVVVSEAGSVTIEKWFVDGRMTRSDGPAILMTRSDGSIKAALYYDADVPHRLDGPAFYEYLRPGESGGLTDIDRSGGPTGRGFLDVVQNRFVPAEVTVETDGSITSVAYFVDGERCEPEDFAAFREALESGAPREWADAFMRGRGS